MAIWICRLVLLFAFACMAPRLWWAEILEGQIAKQSFVAHMISSYFLNQTEKGFPLRFFVEPWHPGVIPWAEEFPLYHMLSVILSKALHLEPVIAARWISFVFFTFLLGSVFKISRLIFPKNEFAPWFAMAIFAWFPGVQVYGTSVMPDMAMLSMIAIAFYSRLSGRKKATYTSLMIAALFKYFAVFAILAFLVFDLIYEKGFRKKLGSLVWSTLSAVPTLAFLAYVILAKIPNPVVEYRGNGYGHLAGPFLGKLGFYSRFFLWVFVKNPTPVLSMVSLIGLYRYLKTPGFKRKEDQGAVLSVLLFLSYTLFALVFASSFYVHDYYALPFMIPILYFALRGFLSIPLRWASSIGMVFLCFSLIETPAKITRQEHYLKASQKVAFSLSFLPDWSREGGCVFVTDFSQPPIPVLSKKSGWSFVANRYEVEKGFYEERLANPKTRAVIFYFQDTDAETRLLWERSLIQWKKLNEESVDGRALVIYIRSS